MNKVDFNALATFDPSYLNELRQLDSFPAQSMVNEILEIFFEIAPKMIEEISVYTHQQNLKALNSKAHSLKSSARNLGAKRMSAMCKQLELATDLVGAPELVAEIKAEYQALLVELTKEFKRSSSAA